MKLIKLFFIFIFVHGLVDAKEEIEILNISDKKLVGFYSIGSAYKLADIVGVKGVDRSAKAEFRNGERSLYFKYTEYVGDSYPNIYKIEFVDSDKVNEYIGVVNGQKLYKVIFVNQYSSFSKRNELYIKFYNLDAQVDPRNLGRLQLRADKIENTFFVKTIKSIKDAEMEERIGACQESPVENREWPHCKPPGYNNLK